MADQIMTDKTMNNSKLSRRKFLKSTAAAGVLAGLSGCMSSNISGNNDKNRPNILFLSVDDMNDWVSFLGGHPQMETPHLDKLAAKSVVFELAYCPAPGCNQSRAATMTGLAPHKTGVYGNRQPFRMSPMGRGALTMPHVPSP